MVTCVCLFLQPTDDIVLMAQTLEKIFLQKVAAMPQEEQELVVTIPKNSHKKGAKLAGRKRWGRMCGLVTGKIQVT